MNELLRGWTLDMERRALAPGTIRRRQQVVRAVIGEVGDPRQLLAEDLELFLDRRRLRPRTRYAWVSHLHAFYRWGQANGHVVEDPTVRMVRPRLDRLLPRPIADEDLALALEQAPPMMRAWLTLMAYAGLRCAEVAGLERTSVLDAHGVLRILGKGSKERMVSMHPLVDEALRAHGLPRTGPIFLRPGGTPWPPARVSRTSCLYLADLGIDATPHQLRHWFGTQVQAATGDLRVTQELLGHASPSTTAGYAAFSNSRGAEAVSLLPTSLRRPSAA